MLDIRSDKQNKTDRDTDMDRNNIWKMVEKEWADQTRRIEKQSEKKGIYIIYEQHI